MSAVRIATDRRASELAALANGLEVYIRHRQAEEAEWDAIEGLPPAYKVGIRIIRKPTTVGLRAWRKSAEIRAGWWA